LIYYFFWSQLELRRDGGYYNNITYTYTAAAAADMHNMRYRIPSVYREQEGGGGGGSVSFDGEVVLLFL